jgi:periplasmic protein CpxP/Spy
MKNLVLIALVLCSLTVTAQPIHHHKENAKDWTPEQRATLATKKMTLTLNLTEIQQKQVYPVLLEVATNRMEMRALKNKKAELSSDELYDIKSEQIEKRIETKGALKNILSPEQFKKWEAGHRMGKRPHKKSIQHK